MKSTLLLFAATLVASQLSAQGVWSGTSTPTSTGYNGSTQIRFETTTWGNQSAILFNSRPKAIQNNGTFLDNSNIEYDVPAAPYGNGAGAITYIGNGGRMDFLVSDVSGGVGSAVSWSPSITITRGNRVGIYNVDPKFGFHIVGPNLRSTQMTLGATTTGNFAITDSQGGPYGLYAGVSGTGNTWLQGGRHDGNTTPYDISLNAAGGNVLIGTASATGSTYRLNVNGRSRMNEVVVNTTGADFVFNSDYRLRPLSEVETFIKENQHLPEIESAEEMQENGLEVGKMETKLLQKVEELTLYMIELQKQVDQLKEENMQLKKQK